MSFSERIQKFLDRTYDDEMDALGWFAFFGLVMVIAMAWGIILRHIAD